MIQWEQSCIHPPVKTSGSKFPVAKNTRYNQIDRGSVFLQMG